MGGTSEIVIRITDSNANTALHKAALVGDLHCLQWLIEQLPENCVSNITNHDCLSPLSIAVKVRLFFFLSEPPNLKFQITNSPYLSLYIFYGKRGEKLWTCQGNSHWLVMSLILMTHVIALTKQ